MKNINWKARIKNKAFWLTAIPTFLLLVQVSASVFGIDIEIDSFSDKILEIVRLIFVLLALMGVTIDPTTEGISDSAQAMTYDEPKKRCNHEDAEQE